jgi:hypothetical protein
VKNLPQELFMILRVITLLRGLLASVNVSDVAASALWARTAARVLMDTSQDRQVSWCALDKMVPSLPADPSIHVLSTVPELSAVPDACMHAALHCAE